MDPMVCVPTQVPAIKYRKGAGSSLTGARGEIRGYDGGPSGVTGSDGCFVRRPRG